MPEPHQAEMLPPPITRLAGLTRLELLMCTAPVTSVDLMRDLPLKELLLHSCLLSTYNQLCSLFVPRALPVLQKLHIEEVGLEEAFFSDDIVGRDDEEDDIMRHRKEESRLPARRLEAVPHLQSLLRLADGVINLPSLQQVSGFSALFDFGMKNELKDWRMSRGSDCSLKPSSILQWTPWLKVWSKAQCSKRHL